MLFLSHLNIQLTTNYTRLYFLPVGVKVKKTRTLIYLRSPHSDKN